MEVQPDFRDLLALLNRHKVEYLIVGSYALAFHGAPRYTSDIDIWIKPQSLNAQRTMEAIKEFGFGEVGITPEDLESPNSVIQLGFPPVRIDLLASIGGLTWDVGIFKQGQREVWRYLRLLSRTGTVHKKQTIPRPKKRSGRFGGFGRRIKLTFKSPLFTFSVHPSEFIIDCYSPIILATMVFMISLVPAKMDMTRVSRQARAMGYSSQ